MKKVLITITIVAVSYGAYEVIKYIDFETRAKENYEYVTRVGTYMELNNIDPMKKDFVEKIITDINEVNKITPYSVDETITLISTSYDNDIKTTYMEYDVEKAKQLYEKNRDQVIAILNSTALDHESKAVLCSNRGMVIATDLHGIEYHTIYKEKETGEVIAKTILSTCKM